METNNSETTALKIPEEETEDIASKEDTELIFHNHHTNEQTTEESVGGKMISTLAIIGAS